MGVINLFFVVVRIWSFNFGNFKVTGMTPCHSLSSYEIWSHITCQPLPSLLLLPHWDEVLQRIRVSIVHLQVEDVNERIHIIYSWTRWVGADNPAYVGFPFCSMQPVEGENGKRKMRIGASWIAWILFGSLLFLRSQMFFSACSLDSLSQFLVGELRSCPTSNFVYDHHQSHTMWSWFCLSV